MDIQKYMGMGHKEQVPTSDIDKDPLNTHYMPIHVMYKQSSTTTETRAMFDASAKSANGVSLNNT